LIAAYLSSGSALACTFRSQQHPTRIECYHISTSFNTTRARFVGLTRLLPSPQLRQPFGHPSMVDPSYHGRAKMVLPNFHSSPPLLLLDLSLLHQFSGAAGMEKRGYRGGRRARFSGVGRPAIGSPL
jgi:hypothetical protein